MELYVSNVLFLSEVWKAVRICSPWEVHTKSPSCDQMNIWSMGILVYLGHMDAITCKCILRVPYGPDGCVRTYRHRGSTVGFLLLQCSSGVVLHPRDLQVSVATRFCRVLIFASSQYLSVIYLFHVMIHWWVWKPPCGPNNCMFWAMIEAEGEVGYP